MRIKIPVIALIVMLSACHKHQPQKTNVNVITKPLPPKKLPANFKFPKMISVNDQAATKTPDGRLYIDVEGHRYWKNYKDGKYYLFNKSMYKNPDFTPR